MPKAFRYGLLVIGLIVLVLIVRHMGAGTILQLARKSGWALLWMAVLYALHLGVRAWVIWRNLPPGHLSLVDVLRIRFAAESVEMLTFTGPFLAEPAKGWMFIRRGVSAADAVGVIAFEYLTYTLVAADLALVGVSVLLYRHALPPAVRVPLMVLVGVLAAFTFGVFYAAVTRIGLIVPAVRKFAGLLGPQRADALVAKIAPMEQRLVALLHDRPLRLVETLAAQFGGHGLLAVEIAVLFDALGLTFRAADPWILEGGVKFINFVFVFVPGQVGAAEGVNAMLTSALGLPAAVGVTLSLLRRVRAIGVAAFGLIVTPSDRDPIDTGHRAA
jgi:lysylphosphatidylglycerol synthase-like protein